MWINSVSVAKYKCRTFFFDVVDFRLLTDFFGAGLVETGDGAGVVETGAGAGVVEPGAGALTS